MPSSLLETVVRPNWEELTQQSANYRLRLWRVCQIAMATAALAALSAQLLFPAWPWHGLLRMAGFTMVLWLLPFWTICRVPGSRRATAFKVLPVALILLLAVVIAYAAAQSLAAGEGSEGRPRWTALLIVLVPGMTWSLLIWVHRRFPASTRQLGLEIERWPANFLIGLAAGAALGFHLLLALGLLPGHQLRPAPTIWLAVWTIFFQAGLYALGVELFFRGLVYQQLFHGDRDSVEGATFKLVLLNLFVYLPTSLTHAVSVSGIFWLLVYGAVLALVTTLLRRRQRNLFPGLVCNVIFSTFIAIAIAS